MNHCAEILDTLGDAVIYTDERGYIKEVNESFKELTGFNDDDLPKLNLANLFEGGQDFTRSGYELEQTRKTGKRVVESWNERKNKSRFWAELSLFFRQANDKTEAGFVALLRDVSARKNAELDLRTSEERYRLMVEGVKDYAIFMLDPKGYILTWNEGARRTKGYSAAEIIGKHFSTFYTAEDLADKKPERELVIAVKTGKYEEEGWRIKKNGMVFWANVVITALYNEQNELIGFSKVTRDLTERKAHEERLRQSEERYRALVQQVTDYGIFMLDDKGRVISWNEGARRINGYTEEEILGKYFSIFYPQEDIIKGKPAMELKTARTEGKYEEEGWRKRKDGSLFWSNVVITAVYNKDKILIGFSKVTRDLTERKESERALHDSFERYRELSEKLKITNAELSLANSELEQFTSIVSHDLQEPIRSIKSNLLLCRQSIFEKRYGDLDLYIEKSITGATRMRELVQALLKYSHPDNTQPYDADINITDLISDALQNLRSAIDNSRAEIKVNTTAEHVKGSKVQLEQVIQNLVGNALKFTTAKKPVIEIYAEETEGGVLFSVKDNGIGIDKVNQKKIFDMFRRLHSEKKYPGMGIGLAICKRIIEKHGGRIWLESEPGKGTTFFFRLPQQTTQSSAS